MYFRLVLLQATPCKTLKTKKLRATDGGGSHPHGNAINNARVSGRQTNDSRSDNYLTTDTSASEDEDSLDITQPLPDDDNNSVSTQPGDVQQSQALDV